MAQPPNPRGPLGQLIERYKTERELEWQPIYEIAGVSKTTFEQWMSGRTREPQLRAMLRVRRFLEIPAEEFEREALRAEARVPEGSTKEQAVTQALEEERPVPRSSKRSARRPA